jgi:hypothetical protein
MKPHVVAVAGISVLVLFAVGFVSIFEIKLASAQVDATSSLFSSDATTSPVLSNSTSTAPTQDVASSTPEIPAATTSTVATSAAATSSSTVDQPPQGLTLVHIVGTKYIDYFTDGKTVTAFPGDPAIDSNFDKPDAPIPTHEGLTWDHTDGGYLYDTPSGDLEVGDYALQPNRSYIENAPPFVSSTSTPVVSSAPDTDSPASTSLDVSASTVSPSPDTSSSPITEAATDTLSTETPITPTKTSSTSPTETATTTGN